MNTKTDRELLEQCRRAFRNIEGAHSSDRDACRIMGDEINAHLAAENVKPEPYGYLFEDGQFVATENLAFHADKTGQRVIALYAVPPAQTDDAKDAALWRDHCKLAHHFGRHAVTIEFSAVADDGNLYRHKNVIGRGLDIPEIHIEKQCGHMFRLLMREIDAAMSAERKE